MISHNKIKIKHIVVYFFIVFMLMIIIPCLCIKIFDLVSPDVNKSITKVDIPPTISLYLTKEKKTVKIPFEEYVQGVVASEMPEAFGLEALKAQAVASRTYALGKVLAGATVCDSSHCQVYRSNNISAKVKYAVSLTKGELLYHDGKLAAHCLYFASSGGKTENSEDVFSTAYPYLVGVKSPYENKATHQKETVTMSISSFATQVKKYFPQVDFGSISKSNIKVLSRSKGNRAMTVQIGDGIIKGTQLRSCFNLFSTVITFSFDKDKITLSTSGSGHGVGMSQYGADGLAARGLKYKKILYHFYQGTVVAK